MKVIQIIGGTQKHQARRNDNVVPCLTSSMGCGGGFIPMVVEPKEEPVCFIDLTRGGTAQRPQEQSKRDTTQESLTEQVTIAEFCVCNQHRMRKKRISTTIDANYWKGLLSNQERPAVLEKW